MKTNYSKATEKILYNYKYLKANIISKKKELELYRDNDGVSGVRYDGIFSGKTNSISTPVEDTALFNMERIEDMDREIKLSESKIERIEEALKVLPDNQRTIIEMKYFKNDNMTKISMRICFSRSYTMVLHRKALNAVKVCFFGLEALEEDL